MTKNEFKSEMTKAATLCNLDKKPGADYWLGYQRGLRHGYHGERGVTKYDENEHNQNLALTVDEDPAMRDRGRGYRDGLKFGGVTP